MTANCMTSSKDMVTVSGSTISLNAARLGSFLVGLSTKELARLASEVEWNEEIEELVSSPTKTEEFSFSVPFVTVAVELKVVEVAEELTTTFCRP